MDQIKKITIKTDNNKEVEIENLQELISNLLNNKLDIDGSQPSKFIMKLDKETKEIKLYAKEELLQHDEEMSHPYFKNLNKNNKISCVPSINHFPKILKINKNDKLLLFSPHPDDEILGACGLLCKCILEKIEFNIVYMTSGKSAGDEELRKSEAINGIKILGGGSENLVFTNFPFYDRNEIGRQIMEDDYKLARGLIRKFNPNLIFICADIFDPHRTHKKCFDILNNILEENEFKNIITYFYYSVWYWPEDKEYTHILPYDYETYKLKIYAMLEHKSQISTNYMGSDSRPFYQRATARDQSFGKIHNYDYCEVYYKK